MNLQNKHSPTNNTTLWSDMDGVIAIYDVNGFRGNNPPFLIKDGHYFAKCRPDERIINALMTLEKNHYPANIVSNVIDSDATLALEHELDKRAWITQYISFLHHTLQFAAITQSKAEYAMQQLNRPLKPTDLLISDYNKDLVLWNNAGGTGIKYLNGINDPSSYDGPKIQQQWTSDEIADYIMRLNWRYINTCNK